MSSPVNFVVCVRKPGPMAEVAIRKAAPNIAEFLFTVQLKIADFPDNLFSSVNTLSSYLCRSYNYGYT
jgi:hypothetical protein